MISIYALVDPRDDTVHYIGLSKNPAKRYAQHLTPRQRNQAKREWIQELLASQLLPKLLILEEGLSAETAFQREAYWTIHYARAKHPLTNLEKTRTGYPAPPQQPKRYIRVGKYWQEATN